MANKYETTRARARGLGSIMSIGIVLGICNVASADAELDAMVDQAMAARTAEESQLPATGPKAQEGKKLVSIVCASAIRSSGKRPSICTSNAPFS